MPDVHITLTQNEALVLFEVLSRFADKGILGTQDHSEQRVLTILQSLLQNVLPEALHRNYQQLLTDAQNELRDPEGTNAQCEKEQGRIAFWLDPSDLEFLVNEWRKMPQTAPESEREQWANISFRAMTALHKSGIKYNTDVPTMGYELVPRDPESDADVTIDLIS